MNFKNWLLFNENIQENFDKWFIDLVKFQTRDDEQNIIRKLCKGPARPVMDGVRRFGAGISGQTEGFLIDNILFKTKHKKELDKEDVDYLSNFNGTAKDIIKTVLQRKNLETFNWFAFSVGYLTVKPNMFTEDLELAIDVTKRRIDSRELLKQEIGSKGWLVIGYESLGHVSQYLSDQQQISNRKLEKMRKQGLTLDEDPSLIKLIIDENNVKIYFLPAVGDNENIIKKRHLVLCKYGKGTDWCTANPTGSYHSYYVKNNIYIVHNNEQPVYQFVDCNDNNNTQFMDAKDHSVRELESDIFDVLYKNLKSQLKCYEDVVRLTSVDDLVNKTEENLKTIYQNLSPHNFEQLINKANREKRNIIFDNMKKYVGKEAVYKFSSLKSTALSVLKNTELHSLQELATAMLPTMTEEGLNDKNLILEFLNEYRAYVIWRYYSDRNMSIKYGSNDEAIENDIYKIFGKEKIEEDYPALKLVSPKQYFYYSYGAHNFELKKPNPDDKEGSLHSIEHVISYTDDVIKSIEKIGGPEKLNFENEKIYDIIFKRNENENSFISILNYFKQHSLENKIKELLKKMNMRIFGDIVGYYAENASYDESLETFKNENFYKILKYIHENKGIDQIEVVRRGAQVTATAMFAIWEYFIDPIKEWSSTGFIRGIFEIVGDKFFDAGENPGYYLSLLHKLINDNREGSKLFQYLESNLPKINHNHLSYALFDQGIDESDDNNSPELLKFIEVLIKNQPENEDINHLIIVYGKLNKKLIDKYPEYSKNSLVKFGPAIGHIDKEGDFVFQQDHLHWSSSIPRENIKYAYKKLLDKDINKFKIPKYNREKRKMELEYEKEQE